MQYWFLTQIEVEIQLLKIKKYKRLKKEKPGKYSLAKDRTAGKRLQENEGFFLNASHGMQAGY